MDFRRPPGAVSRSDSTTTSIGNPRCKSLSEIDWDLFHKRLNDHNIKQNYKRWYAFRVEQLLKSIPDKSLSDISEVDVRQFLQSLLNDSRLKGWKVIQAVHAIQILCTEVLGGNRLSSVNWDDYRLGARSIDSLSE